MSYRGDPSESSPVDWLRTPITYLESPLEEPCTFRSNSSSDLGDVMFGVDIERFSKILESAGMPEEATILWTNVRFDLKTFKTAMETQKRTPRDFASSPGAAQSIQEFHILRCIGLSLYQRQHDLFVWLMSLAEHVSFSILRNHAELRMIVVRVLFDSEVPMETFEHVTLPHLSDHEDSRFITETRPSPAMLNSSDFAATLLDFIAELFAKCNMDALKQTKIDKILMYMLQHLDAYKSLLLGQPIRDHTMLSVVGHLLLRKMNATECKNMLQRLLPTITRKEHHNDLYSIMASSSLLNLDVFTWMFALYARTVNWPTLLPMLNLLDSRVRELIMPHISRAVCMQSLSHLQRMATKPDGLIALFKTQRVSLEEMVVEAIRVNGLRHLVSALSREHLDIERVARDLARVLATSRDLTTTLDGSQFLHDCIASCALRLLPQKTFRVLVNEYPHVDIANEMVWRALVQVSLHHDQQQDRDIFVQLVNYETSPGVMYRQAVQQFHPMVLRAFAKNFYIESGGHLVLEDALKNRHVEVIDTDDRRAINVRNGDGKKFTVIF